MLFRIRRELFVKLNWNPVKNDSFCDVMKVLFTITDCSFFSNNGMPRLRHRLYLYSNFKDLNRKTPA